MPKLIVFNPDEPNVAITFEQTVYTAPRITTWHGTCTNCGETLRYVTINDAMDAGQTHVDSCTPN